MKKVYVIETDFTTSFGVYKPRKFLAKNQNMDTFTLNIKDALQFSEERIAENHLLMLVQNEKIDVGDCSFKIERHYIKN